MSKSNKELAVDIALKYIEATGNAERTSVVDADTLMSIIKMSYITLKELDKENK